MVKFWQGYKVRLLILNKVYDYVCSIACSEVQSPNINDN